MSDYTIEELRDRNRCDTDAMLDWCADEIERLWNKIGKDNREMIFLLREAAMNKLEIERLQTMLNPIIKCGEFYKTAIANGDAAKTTGAYRDAAQWAREVVIETAERAAKERSGSMAIRAASKACHPPIIPMRPEARIAEGKDKQ